MTGTVNMEVFSISSLGGKAGDFSFAPTSVACWFSSWSWRLSLAGETVGVFRDYMASWFGQDTDSACRASWPSGCFCVLDLLFSSFPTDGGCHRSHTTPSPSPSLADGNMSLGNPRPPPLLTWPRGSPA